MMSLCRIALVQWHLITRSDLDVGGNGAILGPNRSGKSTLIDLIQTVLTGGSGNLFRFNRSAGEGGGRSDRDLRSYCLGQLNEHEALRNESVTHIALSFEDPSGARKPVTIGLCIEAPPREGVSIVGRYVAEAIVVGTESFVEVLADDTVRSAPWTVVRDRLERACQESGGRFLRSDTPRNHIREYMRLLFTERRPVEAERFARAFVLALSFEDIHLERALSAAAVKLQPHLMTEPLLRATGLPARRRSWVRAVAPAEDSRIHPLWQALASADLGLDLEQEAIAPERPPCPESKSHKPRIIGD